MSTVLSAPELVTAPPRRTPSHKRRAALAAAEVQQPAPNEAAPPAPIATDEPTETMSIEQLTELAAGALSKYATDAGDIVALGRRSKVSYLRAGKALFFIRELSTKAKTWVEWQTNNAARFGARQTILDAINYYEDVTEDPEAVESCETVTEAKRALGWFDKKATGKQRTAKVTPRSIVSRLEKATESLGDVLNGWKSVAKSFTHDQYADIMDYRDKLAEELAALDEIIKDTPAPAIPAATAKVIGKAA